MLVGILCQTRTNENRIWFTMTSVVGQQKDFTPFGGSRAVSPTGDVGVRANDNEEEWWCTRLIWMRYNRLEACLTCSIDATLAHTA